MIPSGPSLSSLHNPRHFTSTRHSPTSLNNQHYPPPKMDHSEVNHHMPKTMAGMPMTFFSSISTPLYTDAWKPTTAPQYALTCLFLVLLCVVFRSLLAARCSIPWLMARFRSKKGMSEQQPCCAEEDELEKLSTGGLGREQDVSGRSAMWEVMLRAVLDTSLALVSYLL
jgi:copper transporter 1